MRKKKFNGTAAICSRYAAGRFPKDGFSELAALAEIYLKSDPNRPGAKALEQVIEWSGIATLGIEHGDTKAAVWATAQAVHAAWIAEILDANSIIETGVKVSKGRQIGGVKGGGHNKKVDAKRIKAEFQKMKDTPEHKRPAALADRFGVHPSTIRKALKK